MKVYTSYYGNMRNIPEDYFLVSISGWISDDILASVDVQEKGLAPSKSIFNDYKENNDWQEYVDRFKEERLPKVDFLDYLVKWEEIAKTNGKTLDNIVLFCYEKPTDPCHRHIVSEAFENEFKCEVKEFRFENMIRDNYKLIIENNTDILF